VLVEVLKYRATRDPKGRRNRNPTTQRMPWAMIILSVLVNGSEDPPLLVLPLPPVDEGLEAEVPVPMDPARLSEVSPISRCWVKLALGELEPGFVSPKAQMMYSLPRVPLTGTVNMNDGEEPVTCMTKKVYWSKPSMTTEERQTVHRSQNPALWRQGKGWSRLLVRHDQSQCAGTR
jgi:hypothetical protein